MTRGSAVFGQKGMQKGSVAGEMLRDGVVSGGIAETSWEEGKYETGGRGGKEGSQMGRSLEVVYRLGCRLGAD